MTEDAVIAVINNVANRLAKRFKFGYHEVSDMKQQARMYAWEGLESYDGVRPLENFLWTHVRNRLHNFKRDRYLRPDMPCADCKNLKYPEKCKKHDDKEDCELYHLWIQRNQRKKNLMSPIDLNDVDDEEEKNMKLFQSSIDILETKDILAIIDKELPLNMRPLYIKLKFGVKLNKVQRTKIQTTIQEILEKHGYS